MKVIKHTPKPVKPPETFDLIGLSREELQLICSLVGDISVHIMNGHFEVAGDAFRAEAEMTSKIYRELITVLED
jgi:hypothetical protein